MLFRRHTLFISLAIFYSLLVMVQSKEESIPSFKSRDLDLWYFLDAEQEEQKETGKRIAQKSIFDPELFRQPLRCSPGFEPDSDGNCVKLVIVDEEGLFEFYLDKLNDKFSYKYSRLHKRKGQRRKNQSSGERFHLKLPEKMEVTDKPSRLSTPHSSTIHSTKQSTSAPPEIEVSTKTPDLMDSVQVNPVTDNAREVTTTTKKTRFRFRNRNRSRRPKS